MSRPISLCLERRGHDRTESYVRCTATSGRESGLSLAANGDILWRDPKPCICELWVSRDQEAGMLIGVGGRGSAGGSAGAAGEIEVVNTPPL